MGEDDLDSDRDDLEGNDCYGLVCSVLYLRADQTQKITKFIQNRKISIFPPLCTLKITFMQYPAVHTNYIISHCTTLQYNHNYLTRYLGRKEILNTKNN